MATLSTTTPSITRVLVTEEESAGLLEKFEHKKKKKKNEIQIFSGNFEISSVQVSEF
jgi:hypothetical protein